MRLPLRVLCAAMVAHPAFARRGFKRPAKPGMCGIDPTELLLDFRHQAAGGFAFFQRQRGFDGLFGAFPRFDHHRLLGDQ